MSDELTERINGAAIEVHRVLEPGLLEAVYEEALAVELGLRGIDYQRQVEVEIAYEGRVIRGQRLDLLIESQVVVETKAVARMPEIAMAQVLSHRKAARLKRGLLSNFSSPRLIDGVRRISL